VDNPRPRDAVKKSWEVAKTIADNDVNKVIEKREKRIEKELAENTGATSRPAITY
jgi:hypothetical protein